MASGINFGFLKRLQPDHRKIYRKKKFDWDDAFVPDINNAIGNYFFLQHHMKVSPPILLMLSLLEVAEYELSSSRHGRSDTSGRFDRNELILPEIIVEQYDVNIVDLIEPLNKQIWNAGGFFCD